MESRMADIKPIGRGRPGQPKIRRGNLTGKYNKEYKAWHAFVKRCTDPNSEQWHNYGGRGITVFAGWTGPNGFQNFFEYIGPCPGKGLSVDRIDNEKGYERGNVRWATRVMQASNRRTTHDLTLNGITQPIAGWAETLKINEQTLHERLKHGWTVEKTLTTPVKRKPT